MNFFGFANKTPDWTQHLQMLGKTLAGVPGLGYMLGTLYVSPTMALSPEEVEAVVVVAVVDLKATHMLKLLTANQERP